MTAFRAAGARVLPPRPSRLEREVPDLTSFTARESSSVDLEAASIAPPREEWPALEGPVAGRLVEGTLPDDPEARFLVRLPASWNGGLVVAAAPGLLSERSLDLYWSDYCVGRGFAFACTDKGTRLCVSGERVFVPQAPENRMSRWYPRLKALALLARSEARAVYGRPPEKTFAVGVSNGGYLVRCALERDPQLFDGGVEVSGVLWTGRGDTLLDQLPAALRAPDLAALERAGFGVEPRSAGLAAEYRFYWDLVSACLIGELDPGYSGPVSEYRASERRDRLDAALAPLALTGRLERPLVSLAGGLDLLVPAGPHARGYAKLVAAAGREGLHRLAVVARGGHVDRDRERHPWLEALMPKAHAALAELEAWAREKPAAAACG